MSKHPFHATLVARSFRRNIGEDRRAQASFAVVAVLLLVISGASYLVLSQAESRTDRMGLDRETLRRMSYCASSVAAELEEEAYQVALETCSVVEALNSSMLDERFRDAWKVRERELFPEPREGFVVELAGSALHLDFLRLSQDESSGTFTTEGELQWEVESIPSYFALDGSFTLIVNSSTGSLKVPRSVVRHVYLPLPLLLDRANAFEVSVVGGKNRLENMVRYELASLLQWRALCGYGGSSVSGDLGTAALLTEGDVRRALGLAVLFIELECFGTVDPMSADAVLAEFNVPFTSNDLVNELRGKGRFDPADVFLHLNGAGDLDLRALMAQTLYSVVDVLVLRWLDYFQVLDFAGGVGGMVNGATLTLNDILAQLTGEDHAQEAVQAWMSGRLSDAGYTADSYRWMNYGPTDASILVPSKGMDVALNDGTSIAIDLGGYRALDFPSMDVMALECWKDFVVEFRQGTFQLASCLQEFVRAMAMGIADGSCLPLMSLELDPFDERGPIDEVETGLLSTLKGMEGWFDAAIREARERTEISDPLGNALAQFVQGHWREIFRVNQSVDSALGALATSMMEESLAGLEGFDDGLRLAYASMLAYSMRNDDDWGVREAATEAFSANPMRRVGIFSEVFGNITLDGTALPLKDLVLNLAEGVIDSVPGVRQVLVGACQRMLRDASQASGLRADRILSEASSDIYVLSLGGTVRAHERLVPRVVVPWTEDRSSLDVRVVPPTEASDGGEGGNLHMTDPGNASFAAYQALYRIEVRGEIQLTLGCSGDLSNLIWTTPGHGVVRRLVIGFDAPFTCTTSWPLQGVCYSPSATLLGELGEFFTRLWDGVASAFDWLGGAANALFSLLQELLSKLASYALQAIQALSDFLMSVVQGVRDLVDGAVGALIGWIGEAVAEKVGASKFVLEFGGLSFLFEFAANDIFLGRSKEYLRVTMRTSLLGTELTVRARFVDIYRQGPDLIANISLAGGGWRAECVIDPRMMVMDHLVEMRGVFQDFMLELAMPVLVAYDKISLRLSDVPGLGQLFSNIPVPIPGLSASIDAGFEAKYDSPFATHVVINEVELNPPGSDHGREWVELYNPSNQAVLLDGWSLRTSHGVQSVSSMDGQLIQPKSRLVVRFPDQSLDNGGETGYPLGEAVSLMDASGRKLDSMPFLTDYYNDARTWQRTFDASERWEFRNATENDANGFLMVDHNSLELWQKALLDAVLRALVKVGDAAFDLGSLAKLIENVITEVVGSLLDTVARSIVEMSLFIEVALHDCSGTLDGRLRLDLVITGEGLRDALLWIADVVGCALSNLLNPTAVATRAHSIHEVLDDVYIRFGAYGGVGMPKLLSTVAGDQRFQFGGQIEVNLATLIAPPKGPRNWTVNFGVLFKEVPGGLLRSLYPVDADKLVDCWVLRASVHSLRKEGWDALDVWGM